MKLEKEIWKDIEGFEGLYQVSNIGRVKSLSRIISLYNGGTFKTKEKILKQFLVGIKRRQYYAVDINKKTIKVHRLIAFAFLNNELQKEYINHIDGNSLNNDLNNLEWCTPSENSLHASKKSCSFIYLCKKTNKYRVRIKFNGIVNQLGRFKTESEALNAANKFLIDNKIKNKYAKVS